MSLPDDPKERKKYPIITGVMDYFPDAIAEVALVSYIGNEQHNPGEPLHWSREKSNDHVDCLGRHLLARGTRDKDGTRHTAKALWRLFAILQLEIEEENAALRSKHPEEDPHRTVRRHPVHGERSGDQGRMLDELPPTLLEEGQLHRSGA
jgi:hypothetical protein